jgi:glycosyltransferase involved in cell wall biosynthesis
VDAVPGRHFWVANGPQEYRDAIQLIVSDASERRRLSSAGRARMLSHHSWSRSMERLDGLIERVIAARG